MRIDCYAVMLFETRLKAGFVPLWAQSVTGLIFISLGSLGLFCTACSQTGYRLSEYKAWLYSKLMSGSSLEGKALLTSHETSLIPRLSPHPDKKLKRWGRACDITARQRHSNNYKNRDAIMEPMCLADSNSYNITTERSELWLRRWGRCMAQTAATAEKYPVRR